MSDEIDDLLDLLGAAALGAAAGLGIAALIEALKKAKEEGERRRGFE